MNVVHVIQSVAPQSGGPAAVVLNLAAQQALLGLGVSVAVEQNAQSERDWAFWDGKIRGIRGVRHVELVGARRADLWSGSSARVLHETNDIVHVHGVWDPVVWSCLGGQRRDTARIVLMPHGMLSAWSMQQKKLKKDFIWTAALRRRLQKLTCLHALNAAEMHELKSRLPGVPVQVLPNGIDPGEFAASVPAQDTPLGGSYSRYVLSLARLHRMKGPDRLLNAFAQAVRSDPCMADVGLIIAGPDFGMLAWLQQRAAELGIAARVSFPGGVFGLDKLSLLKHALCVCQPSRHEGFSVTLLEAMASGTAVIATPEVNFPEISAAGCGRIVDGDSAELANAIVEFVTDSALREQMGLAAKELVHARYTWETIAAESLRVYQELLVRPCTQAG